LLRADPPYNNRYRSGLDMSEKRQTKQRPCVTCCAQIVTENSSVSGLRGLSTRQLYLPTTPPSLFQIEKCTTDACYKKNVLLNVATVLGAAGNQLKVSLHSHSRMPDHTEDTHNGDIVTTLHIDTQAPIEPLGGVVSCEQLLFGKYRTTCSPNFTVGEETGKTYANAVHGYQNYRNVRIGEHLTLVPVFGKRTPMVISMRCPELGASHTVVSASAVRSHPKFGPNNAIRIVEILTQMAPFVKHCCEVSMALTPATVTDVHEVGNMPHAHSISIDHCFAHNAEQGISAYVGTHVFSLDTGRLNTLAGSHNSKFPTETQLKVHVAVLLGEVPKCLKYMS